MFAAYSEECANPLCGPTARSREAYESLELAGAAQCFGAYVDGELQGFACVFTAALPHYGRKFASVESLFVLPAARASELGRFLMSEAERFARAAGCVAIFYSARVGGNLDRLLMLLDDYALTNHVFCRRLQ